MPVHFVGRSWLWGERSRFVHGDGHKRRHPKMYRSMKTDTYEFDQWLKSHNKSKNMMEKLERRLVPFPIFNAIGFENNGQPASGEVTVDGNTQGYDSGSTRVVSARSFLHALTSDTEEQILTERRVLMLAAILHNENIEWHFNRVQNVVTHIPYEGTTMAVQKQKLKDKKAPTKRKLKKAAAVKHWWEHIPLTLLEDALNVITETPRTHAEVFHFLCAANLVNAYVNRCNKSNSFSDKQINRMFQAKRQIFKQLVILAQSGRSDVTVTMSRLPALLVRIRVERQSFQFSFRGMDDKTLKELFALAIDRRGEFDGYLLQPVATALYQYSYLLRWQSVGEEGTNKNVPYKS